MHVFCVTYNDSWEPGVNQHHGQYDEGHYKDTEQCKHEVETEVNILLPERKWYATRIAG